MVILSWLCTSQNVEKLDYLLVSVIFLDMSEFRKLFSQAKHIAIITGAGVSAESGVPTFRGENEKWRKWRSQVISSKAKHAHTHTHKYTWLYLFIYLFIVFLLRSEVYVWSHFQLWFRVVLPWSGCILCLRNASSQLSGFISAATASKDSNDVCCIIQSLVVGCSRMYFQEGIKNGLSYKIK